MSNSSNLSFLMLKRSACISKSILHRRRRPWKPQRMMKWRCAPFDLIFPCKCCVAPPFPRCKCRSFALVVTFAPFTCLSLEFMNGPMELKNFRLIERHFFRGKLIKNFDFSFGFVIPNSTNTWEAMYEVPPLEEGLSKLHATCCQWCTQSSPVLWCWSVEEMVANPYETKSDSFFFVGDELIIHNKAEYKYSKGRAQGVVLRHAPL